MLRIVVAALLAVGFFALNVWLLRLNQKTPKPEGCEDLKAECSACGISECSVRCSACGISECSVRQAPQKTEEE